MLSYLLKSYINPKILNSSLNNLDIKSLPNDLNYPKISLTLMPKSNNSNKLLIQVPIDKHHLNMIFNKSLNNLLFLLIVRKVMLM